jgi:TRAP-type C4-dicarboxylate transport system permease small subunit
MKTKITSIIAAVIGSLCAALVVYFQYQAVSIMAAFPGVALQFDSRYFWWPLCGAVIFWSLACFGFIWHRKHRHDHAA